MTPVTLSREDLACLGKAVDWWVDLCHDAVLERCMSADHRRKRHAVDDLRTALRLQCLLIGWGVVVDVTPTTRGAKALALVEREGIGPSPNAWLLPGDNGGAP
jgi:hypothetical protein